MPSRRRVLEPARTRAWVYNFAGNANITRFYELAAEVGLFLHVRFGPYVCAEWSNGGLPVWLNWIPGMRVRSSKGPWQTEMEGFLRYMVDLSRPYLAKNGGPIIMAQIENEFPWDDPEYVEWCGDLVKRLDTSIPWVIADKNVEVVFAGDLYEMAAYSMIIIKDGRLLFDTAVVQKAFPGQQYRSYTPIVEASTLVWHTWSELNESSLRPRTPVVAKAPTEQLQLTGDRSDYLTYETTFSLKETKAGNNKLRTLSLVSCEASGIVAFIDGSFVDEKHLASPGGDCSKKFTFQLPVDLALGHPHNLTLVSVSLGIYSLGSNHKKGLTGSVQVGNLDLTSAQPWRMYPGLRGEQLEIYRSQTMSLVPWAIMSKVDSQPLMSWFRTSFQYPAQELMTLSDQPLSILLDCIGLTRGRAYINGHDLGRYWLIKNEEGNFVQRYYFIPPDWLLEDQDNLLLLFDELGGSVSDVRIVASTMVDGEASISLQ